MKEKWTKRRTKIEAWQRNSPADIMKLNLDAIRTEFDLQHERLRKALADFSAKKNVMSDNSDYSSLNDELLSSTKRSLVSD